MLPGTPQTDALLLHQRLELGESRGRQDMMVLAHGPHPFRIVRCALWMRVAGDVGQR